MNLSRFDLLLIASILLAVAILTTGCAGPSPSPDEDPTDMTDQPGVDQIEQPDPFDEYRTRARQAYENRVDRTEALRAVDLWHNALNTEDSEQRDDAELAETYEHLARAHYFVARYHGADGPVVDSNVDIEDSVDAGLEAARQALELRSPALTAAIDAGAPFEAQLPESPQEATDALLWYAKHLDLMARIGDTSTAIATRSLIDDIMEIVSQHKADAHHGAAYRYFGVRHIDRPLGRSIDDSARAFDRSLEIDPEFVLTRLLRARYLATFEGDREAFESELQAIVETSDDIDDLLPENEIARQWAAELLANSSRFFDE